MDHEIEDRSFPATEFSHRGGFGGKETWLERLSTEGLIYMASWSVAAPCKRIAQEFRSLFDEFRSFRAKFKSCYEFAVAEQMEKFQGLDDLEPSDKKRIRIAVEDAARCYLSTQWRIFFWKAIKYRFRMQAVLGIVTLLLLIGLFYLLPKPSISKLPNSQDNLAVLMLLLPLCVATFFLIGVVNALYSRLPYTFRTFATLVWAVAAFTAVAKFRTWSRHVLSTWKSIVSSSSWVHSRLRIQMALLPVAQLLQLALFLIGIVCTLIVVAKVIAFYGRVAASGKVNGYRQPAVQSADVIISLLHISHLITELMAPIQAASVDVKGYSNKRSQITTPSWNVTWDAINGQLGSLVYQIKGPWQEAMRSYYGSAGERIASEAPRIELFIRHQQAKNCLLSNNLLVLRDAIMSTLVRAADGDWHLIGAEEEYANKVIAQRRTRIVRRVIIIGFAIAGAIAAAHFMRNYPALAVTCGLFAFAEFLRLLDPDGPTLLDVAGRVANTLKHGG